MGQAAEITGGNGHSANDGSAPDGDGGVLPLVRQLLQVALEQHGLAIGGSVADLGYNGPTRSQGTGHHGATRRSPVVIRVLGPDLDVGARKHVDAPRRGSGHPTIVLSPCSDRRLTVLGRGGKDVRFASLQLISGLDQIIEFVRESTRRSATSAQLEVRLPLTEGQLKVSRMVAAGWSNGMIARRRCTTESAVRNILTRAADRLGIPEDSDVNVRVALAGRILAAYGITRTRPAPTDRWAGGHKHPRLRGGGDRI